MENPYFEKLADLSCVMWICGGFASCGPSACAFGDQKGLIRNKDMPFGNPPHHGTENCELLKNIDFLFFCLLLVKKWCFGSKKQWFWVFWTGCEVADLNQGQKTIKMNHRNKIQSLVSPTDDPVDARDCMCESGPCTCEYGHICLKSANFSKYGFPCNRSWILSPWCC